MENNENRRYKAKRNKHKHFLFKIVVCILAIIALIFIHKLTVNNKAKSSVSSDNANSINIDNDDVANKNNTENSEDLNNLGTYSRNSNLNVENIMNSEEEDRNIKDKSNIAKNTLNKVNTDNTVEKKEEYGVLSSKGLPVLMYHFFYDNVKYFKKDNNWLKISDFEAQVKYMSDNNFYFPTWDEVEKYVDGRISLPAKSVVITVDDGDPSFFDLAVPILQKYNITATSFVVTSWYGYRYDPNMKNVVFESHSDNMHQAGANGKGRMVNWSYNEIINDIKTSSATLGNCDIFCYPFGHYNDIAMKALKDANYKLAFTVEGGRVKPGLNRYKLPRVRVSDGNSLKYFIGSIS